MSSEDRTLQASEQGQSPPPPTSGGPTPAGSPAPSDRRPRGRPRKDAVTAVSLPKPKKKPRNKGKTVGDDEDSMDGTETVESESPQDMAETKEPQEESEGVQTVEGSRDPTVLPSSTPPQTEPESWAESAEAGGSEDLCGLCHCGARSLLGQGELRWFGPSPGRSSLVDDSVAKGTGNSDSHKEASGTAQSQECPASAAPPSCPAEDATSKFWDELTQVGLPDDIGVQLLFSPAGQCCAHQRCVVWSHGMSQGDGQSLLNVDRAIHSGSTERCAYCKRLGATIKCCEDTCRLSYHYPCAAAAGTFQDIRSHTLLCPEHIQQAVERSKEQASCAVCDSPGDLLDQLFCTSCGQHYHGACLDVTPTPLKRAGWQCPECKVCQTCKNPGEDSKMLVCDMCDKGYHTFCLQPAMTSIPTNGWRCKYCRVCVQCGTRTSAQWHHNCLLCEACFQQQDPGTCCFLCQNPINLELHKDLLSCHLCKRWLHLDCDQLAERDSDAQSREEYVCADCKQVELEAVQDHSGVVPGAAGHIEEPELAGTDAGVEEAVGEEALEETMLCREEEEPTPAIEPAPEVQSTDVPGSPPPATSPDKEAESSLEVTTPRGAEDAVPVAETAAPTQLADTKKDEVLPTEGVADQSVEVPEEAPASPPKDTNSTEEEPMDVSAGGCPGTVLLTETDPETVCKEPEPEPGQAGLQPSSCSAEESLPAEDPTLPLEVGSASASEPTFSDFSSPSEERVLKPSPGKRSESPAKPAQSPLSAEASPKDVAPSQPPSTTTEQSGGGAPSATFISVTPKIGMGKPAISKRKFSPGRPRTKQGVWSARGNASSPSWSPDQDGWDETKTRQAPGTPPWSIRAGRGSGFPGKRRPRGSGLSGRGGRGRSKLKNGVTPVVAPGVSAVEMTCAVKEEEESAMHNTMVMFSSSDSFTLKQDMCVVCGSFGQGAEGRLLACAQCGQCYHPYCVNIKITKVVLNKGWRCLECTVCEACGQATDPGRLLLCDDCDISYHTYCLDPPLQNVPKGSWKCKWCVSCTQCGATSPGLRCEWQNNYTQCGPCASLSACPLCARSYCEDDLIVQCRQCDRWTHASCIGLNSEEELDNAADCSFDCTVCRAHTTPCQVLTGAPATAAVAEATEPPSIPQNVTKIKELDPGRTYTQDGVCLTESGRCQLQSLAGPGARRRRSKPKLKLRIINQNSVAVLQAPVDPQSEHSRDGDPDETREGDLLDCDGKSDSSPEREPADEEPKGPERCDGAKKRKRKPYRPGIGGFMVRQRSRTGQGKAKRSLSRKDSSGSVSESLLGKDEGWTEMPDTPVEETPPGSESLEKAKKRYRKKRTKLEEEFPSYLQEAFFGKDLLDKSKQSRQALEPGLSDDDRARADGKAASAGYLDPSLDPLLSTGAAPHPAKAGTLPGSEDPLLDLSEVLNTDNDILGMLSGDLVKTTDDPGFDLHPFPVPAHADCPSLPCDDSTSITPAAPCRGPRPLPEEPLDGILSPELDKMVTDGAILSKLQQIPELEGKDVEDLFTAVLSPSTSQPPPLAQPSPSSAMPMPNPGNGMFPRMPMMNGIMGQNANFPPTPVNPGGPCIPDAFSPIQRMPFHDAMRDKTYRQMARDPAGPWTAAPGSGPQADGDADTMSSAQKNTLKWEKEETLGEAATVAPVLYTNVNFPNLKEEFPDWSTRVKQIAKLWRKASSQERAPYVQKARDNRAALRINKVQMSNESMKRQHHHQQQAEMFDPSVPLDAEMLFKDPLKHKESEHEQEWKFRQQMRQKSKQQAKIEATQKLEQVKSEQQQLQQQQQGGQAEGEPASGGSQSPVTPQAANGSMSPMQQQKDGFPHSQLPGTPTSGSSDDVFLRPPPPPPAGLRMPAQEGSGSLPHAPSSQPQSPQRFSPSFSGSRPSSPWDPYAKMVGTPRPPPVASSTPRRNSVESGKSPRSEQQERERPSPVHDPFGSPTPLSSDPYAKPPDTPRPMMTADPFLKPMGPPRSCPISEQQGRTIMSSSAATTFARPTLRSETYQRIPPNRMILSDPYSRPLLTPIPGSNESGSVPLFKMPMPPSQSQDPGISMHPAVRQSDGFSQNQQSDPYAHPPLTPRPSTNENFTHPSRMVRHPQGTHFTQPGPMIQLPARDPYTHTMSDPYAQPPGTPRPVSDPYTQKPGPSRPSSDPYAQPPGTPRPSSDPYAQPPGTPRPSSDPYAQLPGTPRPSSDPYAQPPGTPRPSSDLYAQPPGTPRPSSDPYAQPPGTPRPSSDPYAQPPGTPRPSSDPYAQPPGTPRPSSDPYAQPPGTPRPSSDPYAQPPGTPRPSSDPYAQPPITLRPPSDPYAQPPGTPRPSSDPRLASVEQYPQQPPTQAPNRRQSPSHAMDPYAQPPGTPRPTMGETFSKSPGNQRSVDPYTHPSRTPRLMNSDPYCQPPGTPRPFLNDPYSHTPGTPRPGTSTEVFNRPMPRPLPNQDPFSPHQGGVQDTFVRPVAPGSQTPKHTGLSDDGYGQSQSNQPNQTPIHDPYEQTPLTPQPQLVERLPHELKEQQAVSHEGNSQDLVQFSDIPQNSATISEVQTGGHQVLDDTEEKLRQRQRIRELIRRQQQQKSALRQEKGLQEPAIAAMSGAPRQENLAQQNDMFSRPPPPYPGTMKSSLRFPRPFTSDQQHGPFPNEQFARPQFPGEVNNMGMRPHGLRFGFPSGGQGQHGGQEHFLKPNQIPEPLMDVPPQMRRSMSVDLARTMGNGQMGIPQPFPPRGMQMQQHNIMGQPFIELRHRAPENRLRLPYGPSVMPGNVMDPSIQPEGAPGFMTGQEVSFPINQGPRMMDPTVNQRPGITSQMSSSMENLHQQPMSVNLGPQHPPLLRSLSHPTSSEALNPSMLLPVATVEQSEEIPIPSTDGIEEKLDTDDSAVKDLEDVEVKDLVDDDLENLNLDPDDGKDLDLETNDLHLDDFLTSGKFDIIAYTDPELDLEDKKDMFNEELDLSDPIDDGGEPSDLHKVLSEKKATSSSGGVLPSQAMNEPGTGKIADVPEQCQAQVKLEAGSNLSSSLCTEKVIKTEANEGLAPGEESSSCRGHLSGRPVLPQEGLGSSPHIIEGPAHQLPQSSANGMSGSAPVLSRLLVKENLEEAMLSSTNHTNQNDLGAPASQVTGIQQPPNLMIAAGQIPEHAMNQGLDLGQVMNPTQGTPHGNLNITQGQTPCQAFTGDLQVDAAQTLENPQLPGNMVQTQAQQALFAQGLGQQNQQNRPLLLDEQPLLLQDLLDQERQEQQQQRQMQAMIRQRSSDSFFPNIDFDAITDPIMKAKMVALKGINKVMVQNNMGMAPLVMNRFQLSGQQLPGPQCSGGAAISQQAVGQDSKQVPHIVRPNPPSFGPGFSNDTQKKQYEEWLQETQQLLQMQQKFLEEQIGAHRKSKKALSAKQRTAKKAGREFPEEDVEQLKHVTEQQGVVQKQLEQIRKQQKEHAELIEEYRAKHQQHCGTQPPLMAPMPAGGPPVNQPMVNPMMQGPLHPGPPPNMPHMPNVPGWHPGAQTPMVGPRMPALLPPQVPPTNSAQPPALPPPAAVPGKPADSTQPAGDSPHVKFDDNNPFSEGFQERERKERLREQQERQRVQLMQEVERQRALQQRLDMERQGLGPDGGPAGRPPGGVYGTELPHEFVQPLRPQLPLGPMFPQQPNVQPGFMGSPPVHFPQGGDRRSLVGNGTGPGFRPSNPATPGSHFAPGQPRPSRFGGPGLVAQGPGEMSPFGMEPATPLPPAYPGSGQSLIQLYSNIIPEEKGKKKRSRKKKKDDDAESVRTPSMPHSDLTSPLTPAVSDTSSTPTRSAQHAGDPDVTEPPADPMTPGALGDQAEEQPGYIVGLLDKQVATLRKIKLEAIDSSDCPSARESRLDPPMELGMVKVEEGQDSQSPAQTPKGESGNELLKHLLKNKNTPPLLPHQRSDNGPPGEEGSSADSKTHQKHRTSDRTGVVTDLRLSGNPMDHRLPVPEQDKKKQRNKRAPKAGEKPAPRSKKRKKEEEEKQLLAYPSTDTLMTQLKQQLSLLPLMEPLVGISFAHFPPYGSGQLDGESQLSGAFGSASLGGVSDYYSQLIYKQDNLSNPPTPPASLPPTPPPLARQKMVNGFATTEELATKAAVMVTKGLGPRSFQAQFRPDEDLLARAIAQGPKTVDVPASLPTPPHNNHEELRCQEPCEDRDTPDSFVPSSSPESVVGMEISRYPDLSRVKEEAPSPAPAPSPIIPMLPSSSGKATRTREGEIKTEPSGACFGSQGGHTTHNSKSGLVSIAITLNPTAAENITSVVAAVADLLCVKIPTSYEVSGGSLALLGSLRVPHQAFDNRIPGLLHSANSTRFTRPAGGPGSMQPQLNFTPIGSSPAAVAGERQTGHKAQWCCHCRVVILGNAVQKSAKDLAGLKQEPHDTQSRAQGTMVFCSHTCFVLYSSARQPKDSDVKSPVVAVPSSSSGGSPSKAQHQYSNNVSALDVHCLALLQPKHSPPPPSPPLTFPSASLEAAEAKGEALKVTVKLKPRPRAVHGAADDPRHHGKRWKGARWRKWSLQVTAPVGECQLPTEEEVDGLLRKLGTSLRPEPPPRDQRRCCFCHEEGDGLTDGPARLLNLDLDLWVHLNCALWSTEVYETQAGALINVELALRRGLSVRCAYCQRTGATSGCHRLRCANVYHFTCALRAHCTFFKDKTMLCHAHRPRGAGAQEHELRYFAVFRRVYVQRDEVRQLASVVRRAERDHTVRVGSLVLHAVGQLLPQQMKAFHSPTAIFPVGYEATRIYWSMRHGNRRCRYLCAVDERDSQPEFSIRVVEQGHEDLVLTDTTPKGVWDKVLGPVAERRGESGMLKLFPVYLKGEDLFGLTVSAVTRIAESLPGVEACESYTFRYGRNPLMQLPLAVNASGCARSEPRVGPHPRRFVLRPHSLTSSGTSRSYQTAVSAEAGTPYSKQFVHSKSSQYRRMKAEWKTSVFLARSRIQGLGLFAARDIEKYTMVIEYIGTVLRNEVASRKEKVYECQNRGVYMFRIDSERVVDATLRGGPARYINHSCAPNCVAEVVTFEKGHKIIITSTRKIQRGEELCYDYKFDLEDDRHKTPCHCGAVNCRKWMN